MPGFIAILERELRVAVRQRRSWILRSSIAGAALGIFLVLFYSMSQWGGAAWMGRQIFSILGGFALVIGLAAGPLASVDLISRERAEGTLGLLFLTDLRPLDVVFGKLLAVAFGLLLGMTAALPVLAIPFLMGGVDLWRFAALAVQLYNLTFFSLAMGIAASSMASSGRMALGLTIAALLLFTFGFPMVGEEVLGIRFNSKPAAWFYAICPLQSMVLALDSPGRSMRWHFALNVAGIQFAGWCFLWWASYVTARIWRDLPVLPGLEKWSLQVTRSLRPNSAWRDQWKRKSLPVNPILWLEGRHRLQDHVLWALLLISTCWFFVMQWENPRAWLSHDTMVLWPMWSHYLFCLWVAIEAPRRLAEDKQSGALELLLCTPLSPGTILRGIRSGMARRFGKPLWFLMLFYAYIAGATLMFIGARNEPILMALCGGLVVPLQAMAFSRAGCYEGLARGNSLLATFILLGKLGILPWLLFMACAFAVEALRRSSPGMRFTFEMAMSIWTVCHLSVCAFFMLHAEGRLRRNFRELAATPHEGFAPKCQRLARKMWREVSTRSLH